jgi:hypothetical protein
MLGAVVLTATLAISPISHSAPAPEVIVAKTAPSQTGVKDSAYTGKFFRTKYENYRKCIAQREGRGQYWGTGSNGLYESTYQMTDALVRGAAWMMTAELRAMYPHEWREVRDKLLATPGRHWNRVYMDMAFWTILNWRGEGQGARHWYGGRYACPLPR